jgi:hypothetical protein
MNKGSSLNYNTLKIYKNESMQSDKYSNISRRPPSLSESFISEIENYRKNELKNMPHLLDPLIIEPIDTVYINVKSKESEAATQADVATQAESEISFQYKDRCEIVINKLMLFFIHLFLISMFELVFFFNYVTKFEDTALISVFNSLTNSITNTCSNFNSETKVIVDDIFNLFVNTTIINQNALIAYNKRNETNHILFINAIMYFVVILAVNILLYIINKVYYKRRINYKDILLDNLVMITILGIYEYIFFSNIVFKYVTITPDEITKNEVNNFLLYC